METQLNAILKQVGDKLLQIAFSVATGLLVALEASTMYWSMCFLIIIIDVISAYQLGRRLHRKYPKRCDGKFKSEYKERILFTMILVMLGIMVAYMIDTIVRKETDNLAQKVVMYVFVFYEAWSVIENWSSENDSYLPKLLQRVMVNKAERHLDVPLSEIIKQIETEKKKEQDEQERTDRES